MTPYTIFGIVAAIAGGLRAKFKKFDFSAIAYRCFLPVALVLVCSFPYPAMAAQAHEATVSAAPGTLVRWSAPATTRCGMNGRYWPALQETCYYPVDLLHKPGLIKITRSGNGRSESAHISVEPYPYGTEEIDLGDIPQANPSPKDLMRNKRERKLLDKVWRRKEGPAMFDAAPWEAGQPAARGQELRREADLQRQASRSAPHGPTISRRRERRSWLSPTGQ